ncbi:ATP-binding protein [Massilia sp. BJB1822]|uniref:ATP-binding protein n=1 Tax=Massilia sp. BJB1822 TaxID=2744470 RepID=UPI001592DEA9|nr:ATP-binding protein [Massilia sp. BJB1822]NVE00238.1 response regulator [Massilia sp. BJB1822]
MKTLLSRLLLWQTFLLLAAMGTVLVALPFGLFLNESNKAIEVARQEMRGIAPTRALLALLRSLQQHRGLSTMADLGFNEADAGLAASRQAVDKGFFTTETLLLPLGDTALLADFQQVRDQWQALLTRRSVRTLSANGSFDAHNQLVARLLKLHENLIDHFGLRLDPAASSYFLMNAALVEAPQLADSMSRLRGGGAAALARHQAGQEERLALHGLIDRAGYHLNAIRTLLDYAANADPELARSLSPVARASLDDGAAALAEAAQTVVRPSRLDAAPWEYFVRLTGALDAQQRLSSNTLAALETVLAGRADELESTRRNLSLALGALAVLMVGFGVRVVRSVTVPMAQTMHAAQTMTEDTEARLHTVEAIASGDMDQALKPASPPPLDGIPVGRNEAGRLVATLHSMGRMQAALDGAFVQMTQALRQHRADENARDWLKTGLNELGDLMRGEFSAETGAEAALGYLARRLDAGAGAIYLLQEGGGQLSLSVGYALNGQLARPGRLLQGEGVLGQAVRDRRAIFLSQVPPGYLGIASALGSCDATALAALPLLHAGSVVGALELACLRPFSDTEREFLERAREGIAASIGVSMSRHRTEVLLEKTQQQAGELRLQQEALRQNNAELERVNTFRSEFLANVSHELRTPLNSMLVLAAVLRENREGNLTAKQTEYAGIIQQAGKNLLALINDILDLSRSGSGRVALSLEQVASRQICETLLPTFRPEAETKGLEFRIEYANALPQLVCIDLDRTRQVLKNLLSNAFKFTARGGVLIRMDLAEGVLPVPALSIAVRDSGIGVPPSKRELIFEAFRQADGSIGRSYGGAGLGLSISRQLACQMGGALRLQPNEGPGSTFILYLPLEAAPIYKPSPQRAAPSPPYGAYPTLDGKKVLLVDDDMRNVFSLGTLLSGRGMQVVEAEHGRAALERLAEHPDTALVLMDVSMPVMDGYEAMRSIRATPSLRQLPIIAMSGDARVMDEQLCMQAGASAWLAKPLDIAVLLAMIERCVAPAV